MYPSSGRILYFRKSKYHFYAISLYKYVTYQLHVAGEATLTWTYPDDCWINTFCVPADGRFDVFKADCAVLPEDAMRVKLADVVPEVCSKNAVIMDWLGGGDVIVMKPLES